MNAVAAIPIVDDDRLAVLRSVELYRVKSGGIDAVGHDRTSETLVVRFRNLVRYAYAGVTRQKFLDLLNASSPQVFLTTEIIQKHPCERIDALQGPGR